MGTKKKTETHQTVTPTNPDWITNPVKNLTGSVDALGQANPLDFVAGSNNLLDQAAESAGRLGNPAAYGQAQDIFRGVANNNGKSASLLDNLGSYFSPYQQNVIDAAQADLGHSADQAMAQQKLSLAQRGAFGDRGRDIADSELMSGLSRGANTILSGLRDQGFQRATALSDADANRRQGYDLASQGLKLQAGGALADSAGAQDANLRANIGTQSDTGSNVRQIKSDQLQAPLTLLQLRSALMSQQPFQLFNGQQIDGTSTTSTSGLGSALGALGSLANGLGSMGAFKFSSPLMTFGGKK